MAVALQNITSEIFLPADLTATVALMDDNTYVLILQCTNGNSIPDEESIARQICYLGSVCRKYLNCSIAGFYAGPVLLSDAVNIWPRLIMQRDNNVSLRSGAFPIDNSDVTQNESVFRIAQLKHWQSLMNDGYAAAVKEDACNLLDELMESGKLDRSTLRFFYQDYMQMLYTCFDGKQQQLNELFGTPEGLEHYRNAMKSVAQMKNLICYVSDAFDAPFSDEDPRALVAKVIEYINENLEEDIRRSDLADQVHLNPDYLTRVFKKETGVTIKEYITERKMKAAQGLLRTTTLPVSFVAAKMGYCNFSHFSFTYKKVMGCTPQEERAQNGESQQ